MLIFFGVSAISMLTRSTGYYRSNDPDERKLYENVVDYYGVTEAQELDEAVDFPLSIDKVLIAMTDSCQIYIDQL